MPLSFDQFASRGLDAMLTEWREWEGDPTVEYDILLK